MKTILAIIIAAASSAQALTVNWSESLESVTISLTGTGFEANSTLVSPSGLWTLTPGLGFGWYHIYPEGNVEMHIEGRLDYLGVLPESMTSSYLSSGVYNEDIKPGHLNITGNNWYGMFEPRPDDSYGWNYWTGTNILVITDIPSLEDSSTWSWMAQYRAAGRSLKVPESGSLMLGFLTLLILPAFRDYLALRKRMR